MNKKRMIGLLVLSFILVAIAVLLYPIAKTRFAPSPVIRGAPGLRQPVVTDNLYRHVEELSVKIGSRSVFEYGKIEAARTYIESVLTEAGIPYSLQTFLFGGKPYSNIIVTFRGKTVPEETVLFGAHYDTVPDTPGADDNASGVAILLEMGRALKDHSPGRTLKLVFFALEEPPVFDTDDMGSRVYAQKAKETGENIHVMVSLEMVGYYSDAEGGQSFPLPFMNFVYSSVPNFVAVVGDRDSKDAVESIKKAIQKVSEIPVETLSASRMVPGIDLSDHASFWKAGYRAAMVTDTSFYRNPNYHNLRDTIETLDFDKMTQLLRGLVQAAMDLSLA